MQIPLRTCTSGSVGGALVPPDRDGLPACPSPDSADGKRFVVTKITDAAHVAQRPCRPAAHAGMEQPCAIQPGNSTIPNNNSWSCCQNGSSIGLDDAGSEMIERVQEAKRQRWAPTASPSSRFWRQEKVAS